MNWQTWTPPAMALALSALWISNRKSEVVRVRDETDMLQEGLANVRLAAERELKTHKSVAASTEVINWSEVAGWLPTRNRSKMGMREMTNLQQALMEMEEEEIWAALEEIQALDLGRRVKRQLEEVLVQQLVQENPALVLERFADRINDPLDHLGWVFSSALEKWINEDSAAAMVWYETEQQKGTFDSKSLDGSGDTIERFKSVAVLNFAKSDMAAAGRLLIQAPEVERRKLLQKASIHDMESVFSMVTLGREYLSEEDRRDLLAGYGSDCQAAGLAKVDELITEIDASTAERDNCRAGRLRYGNGPALQSL